MTLQENTNTNSILIVDDEVTTRALLKARLGTKEGYKIFEACNGKEALIEAHDKKPDIILLDWKMPDFSGIEALEKLRKSKETKDIPVIMLTSKQLVSDVEQAFETGALAFIAKPLDLSQVSAKVQFFVNQQL